MSSTLPLRPSYVDTDLRRLCRDSDPNEFIHGHHSGMGSGLYLRLQQLRTAADSLSRGSDFLSPRESAEIENFYRRIVEAIDILTDFPVQDDGTIVPTPAGSDLYKSGVHAQEIPESEVRRMLSARALRLLRQAHDRMTALLGDAALK